MWNKVCHEIYRKNFIPCYLDDWWWSMVYFNVFSWLIERTKVNTYQITCLHACYTWQTWKSHLHFLQELFCFNFPTTFCSNWWHLTTGWERNSLMNLSEVRSSWKRNLGSASVASFRYEWIISLNGLSTHHTMQCNAGIKCVNSPKLHFSRTQTGCAVHTHTVFKC